MATAILLVGLADFRDWYDMAGVKHSNGHRLEGILPLAQPPSPGPHPTEEDVGFDLEAALAAVRPLRSTVPPDCHSAATLGTEREGSAVLIDKSGLLLTIGYLIVEATDVVIGGPDGKPMAAQAAGYDHETGFGLVRTVEPFDLEPLKIAPSVDHIERDTPVVVAAHGGAEQSLLGQVADRRVFAGSWEYMLDSAIFTYPLHPHWSGGALIDQSNGSLVGIGSLFVQGVGGSGGDEQGNMFVPIDLLAPIYSDLVQMGRYSRPPRPWLGMHATEALDSLVVAGVFDGGPADTAGIRPGDLLEMIEDETVTTLEALYRRMWSVGDAGADVKLSIIRGSRGMDIFVRSADRRDFYKIPRRH
jgi:S1-C subfamily serine protease